MSDEQQRPPEQPDSDPQSDDDASEREAQSEDPTSPERGFDSVEDASEPPDVD